MRVLKPGDWANSQSFLVAKELERLRTVCEGPELNREDFCFFFKEDNFDLAVRNNTRFCLNSQILGQAPGFREPCTKQLSRFNHHTQQVLTALGVKHNDVISRVLATFDNGVRRRLFVQPKSELAKEIPNEFDNMTDADFEKNGPGIAIGLVRPFHGLMEWVTIFSEPYVPLPKDGKRGRTRLHHENRFRRQSGSASVHY